MLTLLLALPVLAAGALGWWAMQHRSPDGAFRATTTPIDAPSRVLVVPDVDAILSRDAPAARAGNTTLRLRAPGFLGIADPADVAAYLARVDYTAVERVSLARGPLPVSARHIVAAGDQLAKPQEQDFWVRRGEGELSWTPAADQDRQVALVIVAPPGEEPVALSVAVTAGWLGSTTWGLLVLGPVMVLLAFVALAWPSRPHEIVYVLDAASATLLPDLTAGRTVIHIPAQPASAHPADPPHPSAPPATPAVTVPAGASPQPAPAPAVTAVTLEPVAAERVVAEPVAAVPADAPSGEPKIAWPPAETAVPIEPPRDLPMPVAGAHLHLIKRP